MKIVLLSAGGLYGLEKVAFPVEVDARYFPKKETSREHYGVAYSELIRIGADECYFDTSRLWPWLPSEVEVVS